ncbi:MAG: DUF4198 domain-containing protein [Pseudomonadales bacterium]
MKMIKQRLGYLALASSVLFAGASASVQAHPMWILPSEFSTSGDASQWLTFDVTASHAVFGFDKGVSADNIEVTSPDGDQNPLDSFFKGHRRSVFDLELTQEGTYRIQGQRPPFYFTSYKSGKRDTAKRMMADKVNAKEKLPANARDIKTELIDMSTVVYVSRNAPSDTVFKPKGKGFELTPITHPNDIIQGEEANFILSQNGEPAAGVEVEITPGGTRYRNDRNSIKITTDASGEVNFTPEQAGPWLMYAELTAPSESSLADEVWSARYLTFEVIPQ